MTRIEPFTEDALLSAVLELAHLRGWLVYHVRNSRAGVIQGDVGFPDLVLVRGGTILFIELKSGKLRPSPAQRMWLDALNQAVPFSADFFQPEDWLDGSIDVVLR